MMSQERKMAFTHRQAGGLHGKTRTTPTGTAVEAAARFHWCRASCLNAAMTGCFNVSPGGPCSILGSHCLKE